MEKAAKAAEEAAKAQEIATKAVDEAKQLPTKLESGFGHGGTKHAPRTPAQEADLAKGTFDGKSITFFDDEAALAGAVEQAPKKLPEALAKDPAKAAKWDEFVNNPKEGDKFGFVYEADGPVGHGYTKNPDGTVSPSGPLNRVYIQYQWVKGPGGKLVLKVKNVYPKEAVVPRGDPW